ncbi:MAG TPA: patatin-like phospholipase family protein [Thermoanaerobaculia bacterium]|jgi:predicted acylesterase/phospholipase RssA|nr:patatin-like phospholipase family protein [Thermoanaerobaculia bacterium]
MLSNDSPDGRAASSQKIGLALAGGGPEGAIYEIGVLRALDEALEGVDLTDLHIYVGVSAGAFINANLANNITTAQMCRAIVSQEPGEHPFVPETFMTPALGEMVKRGLKIPGLVARALGDYVVNFRQRTLFDALLQLSGALPVGVFDNAPIREYLEKIYNMKGRTDDFRRLGKHLVVVAADLDSGQAVRFGEPGFDHVPISRAVQASGALPGLYPPVEIDGRCYVDGVLLKTLHASVALEAGADLVICVNPIVPVDTVRAVEAGIMKRGNLLDRGLPAVMSQTFRTLIHSRLEVGMAAYETKFKDADVVLIQPERDDYLMFFTNIFGFAERRTVAEHAYTSTRRYLLQNYDRLEPVFARHGLRLRRDVLEQERELWSGVWEGRRRKERHSGNATVRELDDVLARLEKLVEDRLEGHRAINGSAGVLQAP